jgi:hypothetical protein
MAKNYPNRSDLRNPAQKIAVQTAPSSQYGEAAALQRAQQAVPMAPSPTAAVDTTPTAPRLTPGQFGPLDRPTERPQEPLTAGAPFGPGRTPTAPGFIAPRNNDPVLNELRALYAQFPSEDLADMLDSYIREGY